LKLPLSRNGRLVARQVAVIAVAAAVLAFLARSLGGIDFEEVAVALRGFSARTLAAAVALTVAGYVCLVGYDYLALRYLRKTVPWPRLVFASLNAFALQRNVGPAPITGGFVRYRYYRPCGLGAGDAVAVTLLCGFAFTLGIVFTAGLALTLRPQGLTQVLAVPGMVFRAAGIILLIGLVAYLLWTHFEQREIRIRSWIVPAPSFGISMAQLAFGVLDLALVAGVVYVLLPETVALDYPAFVGFYVLAMVVGAVSHVPGGVGVFEATLAVLLPGAGIDVLLASLLAFRGTYYLLPLGTMALTVGLYEVARRMKRILCYPAKKQR
jgi:phosphatidylglycerol lysyltransferase